MKTRIIVLSTKDDKKIYACGSCFAVVGIEDDFCWSCGCEFLEFAAYDIEDLLSKTG